MNQHPNDKQYDLDSGHVFVFGSNLSGVHGAGAAKFAREKCGAEWGKGIGPQGNSYAIPTKDEDLNTLSLEDVESFVLGFITHANANPNKKYFVTRIGCGLAGFTDKQIAPLFKGAPSNCILPHGWENPDAL